MNHTLPVLIVGAGPTGLMMAVLLKQLDIPFRIIDKRLQPTTTSNALGIQTRTLALFDDIGLIQAFRKDGNPFTTVDMYTDIRKIATVHIDQVNSRFHCGLIMPQSQTENIFIDTLKAQDIEVERGSELIEFSQHADHVTALLNNKEQITAQWLIACDGAHSSVRRQLQKTANITFKGDDIPQQFLIADITAKTPVSHNALNVFFSKTGLLATFPLADGGWRVVINLNHESKNGIDNNTISKIIKQRSHGKFHMQKNQWSSTFNIHSKVINQLRCQRVFFAGDAAHIHSPAGGQGMNTGLQDVYNLAWKLAFVIRKQASPSILDSYHQERYPVIREVVKTTERMTNMMLYHRFFFRHFLSQLIKLLMRCKKINKIFASRISQMGITYTKSDLVNRLSVISSASPQPGQLLPHVAIDAHTFLSDYCRGLVFHLLIFTGKSPNDKTLLNIKALIENCLKRYYTLVKPLVVTPQANKQFNYEIVDASLALHQHFNVKQPALCLIRPDNYIAYCKANLNESGLHDYFQFML